MTYTSARAIQSQYNKAREMEAQAALNSASAYGSARFMAADEMEQAGLYNERHNDRWQPVLAGRSFDGQIYRYGLDGHITTVGISGSGKGTACVYPNLISYPEDGSFFVVDPKASAAVVVGRTRRRLGQRIWLFDPFEEAEGMDDVRKSFNPFDTLNLAAPTLIDDLRILSSSIVVPEDGRNRYFSDAASSAFEAIALLVLSEYAPEHRNLKTMIDIAFADTERFTKQYLPRLLASNAFDGLVRQLGGQVAGFTAEGGTAIWSTLRRNLNPFMSPKILAALQSSDVDFRTIKSIPTGIFLSLPATRLQTHSRYLRLMLSSILVSLMTREQPTFKVLGIVDECAALGRLDLLADAFAIARSFGILLWVLYQDISQLSAAYPDKYQTFIANSHLIQCLNASDVATCEYFSKLAGTGTIETLSHNIQPGQVVGSGSIGMTARPVLTPDELGRLPGNQMLLFYDRHLPILAQKLCYYSDREFAGLFDADPFI